MRYFGVLDSALSSAAFSARLTDKVISFQKFGSNPDVDTATEEDVWDVGGDYTYIDTPSVITIVSTSADDTNGGAGIHNVEVTGIDENGNLALEQIDLNGTTPVITTTSFLRVFRVKAVSGGTSVNQGMVGTLTASAGATLQAQINIGNTTTKMSMISVPKGFTGFISGAIIAGGPNDDFIVDAQLRDPGGVFVTSTDIEVSNSSNVTVNYEPYVGPLPEGSDFKFRAQAVNNNANVRVSYNVVFVRNDYLESLVRSI